MCADVVERRGEAVLVEPRAGLGPAVFGAVAEGEQRLLAAERRALPRDGEHLLGRHERRLVQLEQLRGGVDEDAVVAAVAAQRRERDEHLARVGDDAGTTGCRQSGIPHGAGELEQPLELLALGAEQRLGVGGVETRAGGGSLETRRRSVSRRRLARARAGSPNQSCTVEPRGGVADRCPSCKQIDQVRGRRRWQTRAHGDPAARLDSARGRAVGRRAGDGIPQGECGDRAVDDRQGAAHGRRVDVAARRPEPRHAPARHRRDGHAGSPPAATTSRSSAATARAS